MQLENAFRHNCINMFTFPRVNHYLTHSYSFISKNLIAHDMTPLKEQLPQQYLSAVKETSTKHASMQLMQQCEQL